MSIPSHTTHLGYNVHIDELVEVNTLTMRSATAAALAKTQDAVDWTVDSLRKENADLQGKLAQAEIQIAGLSKPAKEEKAK
jgi:hypothetical protein